MVEPIPTFVPAIAFEGKAQVQNAGRAGFRPEHPRLFQTLANDAFAAALDDA